MVRRLSSSAGLKHKPCSSSPKRRLGNVGHQQRERRRLPRGSGIASHGRDRGSTAHGEELRGRRNPSCLLHWPVSRTSCPDVLGSEGEAAAWTSARPLSFLSFFLQTLSSRSSGVPRLLNPVEVHGETASSLDRATWLTGPQQEEPRYGLGESPPAESITSLCVVPELIPNLPSSQ